MHERLDCQLVLTQLVNHERLNLLGLYIASHIMQGSWQNTRKIWSVHRLQF
jgi:hypothetical protein